MCNDIYKLLYASSAKSLLSNDDLMEILEKSRANNSKKDITGILLYHDGNFIQLLEGKKEDVVALYEKIGQDERHRGIIRLMDECTEVRDFPEWSMGFEEVDKAFIEETIPGFFSLMASAQNLEIQLEQASRKARVLLNTFRKTSGLDRS